MKIQSVVWPEPNRAVIEEQELGEPGPGEVLIETICSAISPGTERAWLAHLPNTSPKFPQVPGYSAVGKVLACGKDVQDLAAGDLVEGGCHSSHILRKRSEVIPLPPESFSNGKFPDGGLLEEMSFTTIAAMSLQGVRRPRIELGETVLIFGQGLLGLFALQFACRMGADTVIVCDPIADRRTLAMELGAGAALDPSAESFRNDLREVTGGVGVPVVIEVTGRGDVMQAALRAAAWEGRVVALGSSRELSDGIDFYRHVHAKGVQIIGAHNSVRPTSHSRPGCWTMRDDRRATLKLFATGRLRAAPMIRDRYHWEESPQAYARLLDGDPALLGMVIIWNDSLFS